MAWKDLPEEVRTKIERNFARSYTTLGSIESPTQQGLLLLAKKGAEIWNAWSESNPDFHANFSNQSFNEELDFSGFIFPQSTKGKTSFKNSKFTYPAKFSNCKFSPTCEMEEIYFGNHAEFKFCTFPGKSSFRKCRFDGPSTFEGSRFLDDANFSEVSANAEITFENATFTHQLNFRLATIRKSANLSKCEFHGHTIFNQSKSLSEVDFSDSKFFSETEFTSIENISSITFKRSAFKSKLTFARNKVRHSDFSGATFQKEAFFNTTAFQGEHYFKRCFFFDHASFRGCEFSDHAEFDLTEFKSTLNFSCYLIDSEPKEAREVKNVSFSGCRFSGKANFNNRIFSSKLNFAKKTHDGKESTTEFEKAPTFHGCKFHQDTTFHGANFHQDHGDEAARAYRTLKLAFEQLKSTREEQRFFKHEMQAERPDLTGWKWLFSSAYGLFSDHGFSIWRPLVTLLTLSIAIGAAHGSIANAVAGANWKEALTPQIEHAGSHKTFAAIGYVLINTIPAPGTDKLQQKLREDLFKTEERPSALSTMALGLEFFHKFAALLCVFLSGLAVRNLLKMKS